MIIVKNILVLMLIILIKLCYCQSNSNDNYQITCNANHFFNIDRNAVNGSAFSTEIGLQNNMNTFSFGPVWWIDKNKEVSFFRGGLFSYKYFVQKNNNQLFNLFFVTDVIYTFEKETWKRYEDIDNTPVYSNVSFSSKWNSIKLLLGYGFNLNLNKTVYLFNNVSFGMEMYNYSSVTTIENYPQYNNQYSSGSIFNDTKPVAIMKFGIGFKL